MLTRSLEKSKGSFGSTRFEDQSFLLAFALFIGSICSLSFQSKASSFYLGQERTGIVRSNTTRRAAPLVIPIISFLVFFLFSNTISYSYLLLGDSLIEFLKMKKGFQEKPLLQLRFIDLASTYNCGKMRISFMNQYKPTYQIHILPDLWFLAPNQNGENIDEFFEFSSEWWSRQTTRQRRKKLFRNSFQYKFKMRCCVRRRTAILIRYTLKTPSVQY